MQRCEPEPSRKSYTYGHLGVIPRMVSTTEDPNWDSKLEELPVYALIWGSDLEKPPVYGLSKLLFQPSATRASSILESYLRSVVGCHKGVRDEIWNSLINFEAILPYKNFWKQIRESSEVMSTHKTDFLVSLVCEVLVGELDTSTAAFLLDEFLRGRITPVEVRRDPFALENLSQDPEARAHAFKREWVTILMESKVMAVMPGQKPPFQFHFPEDSVIKSRVSKSVQEKAMSNPMPSWQQMLLGATTQVMGGMDLDTVIQFVQNYNLKNKDESTKAKFPITSVA